MPLLRVPAPMSWERVKREAGEAGIAPPFRRSPRCCEPDGKRIGHCAFEGMGRRVNRMTASQKTGPKCVVGASPGVWVWLTVRGGFFSSSPLP